jgi:GxxExxY protein
VKSNDDEQVADSCIGMPDALQTGMPTATAETLNKITSRIIEVGINIHRALGPGLLESAYLTCLTRDLVDAQLQIETQRAIPLVYKTVKGDCAYRADLVVEGCVLIEVKAIEEFAPIHRQQVYTYLRLGDYPLGLLMNFGAPTMKAGIKRVVNRFPDPERRG